MIESRIAVDISGISVDDIAFVYLQMSARARLADCAMQYGGAPKLPSFALSLQRGVHLLTTPQLVEHVELELKDLLFSRFRLMQQMWAVLLFMSYTGSSFWLQG